MGSEQKKFLQMLKSRKTRSQNILRKYGDAWLVISYGREDTNIDYLLGVHTYGLVLTLLTPEKLYVIINSLEESFVRDKEHIDHVDTFYGGRDFSEKMRRLLKEFSGKKILANFSTYDVCPHASAMRHGYYIELEYLSRKYDFELCNAGRFVYELRKTKTKEELEILKESVKKTLAILDNIATRDIIKPRKTEREIMAELYKECYSIAEPSFEPIVASGPNTANPHHISSDRKIRENDIVYIDFGVRYLTMSADITRVYIIGSMDKEIIKTYTAVFDAQNNAINSIKPGIEVSEPDRVARETLQKHGYDPSLFSHSLGHPLGVDVHDVGERLSKSITNKKIEPYSAYTVEPALYFKDKFGVRIEDDIVILEDQIKRLSRAPEEPIRL